MAEYLDDRTRGPALVTDCSKELDVAALGQKLTPVSADHGHVINTDYIYIGQEQFRKLFYSVDGEHFQINSSVCTNPCSSDEVECLYKKTLFNNKFIVDNKSYIPLNLIEHILEKYETDMGVPRACWEACSVIDLEQTLSCITSLCDVGGGCEVLCALKWSEICQLLQSRIYTKCYGQTEIGPDCAVREILVISAIFKSANSDVKDCTVKFRFAVDWCCDPFYNPWLSHFVNPQSAIGALFLTTQQGKEDCDGNALQVDNILYSQLPPCAQDILNTLNDAQTAPYEASALAYGTQPSSSTLSITPEDFDKRVQLSATNFQTYVKAPNYGYLEGDPFAQKKLIAGITDTPATNEIQAADAVIASANATDYNKGLVHGVAWTTNPCGGKVCGPNAPDGVWPKSWPTGVGVYDPVSIYAAGKCVDNWWWPDWCFYQVNVQFKGEHLDLAYQPIRDTGSSWCPLTPPGKPALAKNYMIPVAFKFLPWINDNCTKASLRYWCDYQLIDKTATPADLVINKAISSDGWTLKEDGVVLPVFNDSSKHPRLEILLPADCDSGAGESITTYVIEFCISEAPLLENCNEPEPEAQP